MYSKITSNDSLLRVQVQVTPRRSLKKKAIHLSSHWSKFFQDSVPSHILHFPETVQFATEVWVNAEDPQVISDKRTIYTPRTLREAYQCIHQKGTTEPIIKFTTPEEEPDFFVTWKIKKDKLADLSELISLPQGFELAKVRFNKNGSEEYFPTVNMYKVAMDLSPVRKQRDFVRERGSKNAYFINVQATIFKSTPTFGPSKPFCSR